MSVMTDAVKVEPVEYLPPRVLKGVMPDGTEVAVYLWDAESGEIIFRDDEGRWSPGVEVKKP